MNGDGGLEHVYPLNLTVDYEKLGKEAVFMGLFSVVSCKIEEHISP
jgi:hypothetical protein